MDRQGRGTQGLSEIVISWSQSMVSQAGQEMFAGEMKYFLA